MKNNENTKSCEDLEQSYAKNKHGQYDLNVMSSSNNNEYGYTPGYRLTNTKDGETKKSSFYKYTETSRQPKYSMTKDQNKVETQSYTVCNIDREKFTKHHDANIIEPFTTNFSEIKNKINEKAISNDEKTINIATRNIQTNNRYSSCPRYSRSGSDSDLEESPAACIKYSTHHKISPIDKSRVSEVLKNKARSLYFSHNNSFRNRSPLRTNSCNLFDLSYTSNPGHGAEQTRRRSMFTQDYSRNGYYSDHGLIIKPCDGGKTGHKNSLDPVYIDSDSSEYFSRRKSDRIVDILVSLKNDSKIVFDDISSISDSIGYIPGTRSGNKTERLIPLRTLYQNESHNISSKLEFSENTSRTKSKGVSDNWDRKNSILETKSNNTTRMLHSLEPIYRPEFEDLTYTFDCQTDTRRSMSDYYRKSVRSNTISEEGMNSLSGNEHDLYYALSRRMIQDCQPGDKNSKKLIVHNHKIDDVRSLECDHRSFYRTLHSKDSKLDHCPINKNKTQPETSDAPSNHRKGSRKYNSSEWDLIGSRSLMPSCYSPKDTAYTHERMRPNHLLYHSSLHNEKTPQPIYDRRHCAHQQRAFISLPLKGSPHGTTRPYSKHDFIGQKQPRLTTTIHSNDACNDFHSTIEVKKSKDIPEINLKKFQEQMKSLSLPQLYNRFKTIKSFQDDTFNHKYTHLTSFISKHDAYSKRKRKDVLRKYTEEEKKRLHGRCELQRRQAINHGLDSLADLVEANSPIRKNKKKIIMETIRKYMIAEILIEQYKISFKKP